MKLTAWCWRLLRAKLLWARERGLLRLRRSYGIPPEDAGNLQAVADAYGNPDHRDNAIRYIVAAVKKGVKASQLGP